MTHWSWFPWLPKTLQIAWPDRFSWTFPGTISPETKGAVRRRMCSCLCIRSALSFLEYALFVRSRTFASCCGWWHFSWNRVIDRGAARWCRSQLHDVGTLLFIGCIVPEHEKSLACLFSDEVFLTAHFSDANAAANNLYTIVSMSGCELHLCTFCTPEYSAHEQATKLFDDAALKYLDVILPRAWDGLKYPGFSLGSNSIVLCRIEKIQRFGTSSWGAYPCTAFSALLCFHSLSIPPFVCHCTTAVFWRRYDCTLSHSVAVDEVMCSEIGKCDGHKDGLTESAVWVSCMWKKSSLLSISK